MTTSLFAQAIDPIERERRARAKAARIQWHGGQLMDSQLRREEQGVPKMGEAWNPEHLPYWREEMDIHGFEGSSAFGMWATVHDVVFWQGIGKRLGPSGMAHGLQYPAAQGNTQAFEAASPGTVALYIDRVRAPIRETNAAGSSAFNQLVLMSRAQARIVHPEVALWLEERGYFNREDLAALAQRYSVEEERHSGIVNVDPIGRGVLGFTPDYLSNWATKALRDLGWGPDAQARFVANTMLDFGMHWKELFEPACVQWLHEDVDLSLLRLCLGTWYSDVVKDTTSMEDKQLYVSVERAVRERNKQPLLEWSVSEHPVMAMLMDLTPPTGIMDLYAMAVRVKNKHRDVAPEMLVLPTLSE